MSRDDAREICFQIVGNMIAGGKWQEQAIDLVQSLGAAEREACAKIAEEAAGPFPGVGRIMPCVEVAIKIRARGEK